MNHTLAALALALLLGPGISAQARSSRKNDDRKASVSWSAAADYATGTPNSIKCCSPPASLKN